MAQLVTFPVKPVDARLQFVDVKQVEVSRVRRQLSTDMIQKADAPLNRELAGEHTAEPIKSVEDINRISTYLIDQKRYRDNMLFILGINLGLRVSDLLSLQFGMLIDDTLSFRDSFPILEKKTRNTRRVKRNRHITINDAVCDAVLLYLVNCQKEGKAIKLNDYLFRSESNNGEEDRPLSRMSVDRILKGIAKDLNLKEKVSSHTLRKTFGYHQMMMSGNDHRKLLLLQKMFGHSSVSQTLDYIGITTEEIASAYMGLNLGNANCYKTFGVLAEDIVEVI